MPPMSPIAQPAIRPLSEAEMDELQALLDSIPAPLEPLDVVMLDGYLCGVLLQPRPVPAERWLPTLCDVDGRAPPKGVKLARLQALAEQRHAELNRAIHRRDWFDPWVYELDEEASPSQTVMPWVAGFATAMTLFPQLTDMPSDSLLEPLALLYSHLDPDELEDADELLEEIDTLEPPATLDEAVEDLVRSVLLLADISRPRAVPSKGPVRRAPPGRPSLGGKGGRR